MRNYEGLFILDPAKGEDTAKQTLSSVAEVVKQHGGEIKNVREMGRQKLFHPLGGMKEGLFYEIHISLSPDKVADFKRVCRLKEGILRFFVYCRKGGDNGESK